jgi:FKBP-type peptidyl-prolyl cis-trans isomerase FklB
VLATFVYGYASAADDRVELKSEIDQVSYAIGHQIGEDFKGQQMELNGAAVVQGIADAQKAAAPLMSEEAMRTTLIELKHKIVARERAAMPEVDKPVEAGSHPHSSAVDTAKPMPQAKRMAAQGNAGAQAFFEENAKKEGIVTLPSGVQYKVLKEGSGKQPMGKDKVELVYRASTANGNEFGSTDRNGKPEAVRFSLEALVPGLRDAVSHMKEGAEWKVFVPPQLGFDASTPLYRKITVFDIRLASVVSD